MKDFRITLEYNSVPKVLDYNPIGWNDITISFERNEVYHSVLRSVTTPLKFVDKGVNDGGGYQFLVDAYEQDGIKALITVTIDERNQKTNGYDFFYGGILLLTPDKWGIDLKERTFEAGIIDSAKLQQFKSNEDVEIDLNSTTSLNGTAITPFVDTPRRCSFKSIDIYLIAISDGSFSGTGSGTTSNVTVLSNYSGNQSINEIGSRLTIEFPAIDENIYNNSLSYNADFYSTSFAGNNSDFIQINGAPASQPWTYIKDIVIIAYDGDGNFQEQVVHRILSKSGTGDVSINYNDSFATWSFSPITIDPNGYVAMQTKSILTTGGVGINKTVNTSTNVSGIKFVELTEGASDYAVQTFLPAEAFDRAVQITANEVDTTKLVETNIFGRTDSEFTSYPSDGEYAYYSLNSGWNIRQYPDKPFLVTFKDLFKSYDSILNLTLIYDRVNEKFIIGKKTEAYKNFEMFVINDASNFNKEPAPQWYYNKISTGYPKQTFEEFQGVNEINLEAEHYIDMPVKNTLDIRSIYSASPIAIELMRRKRYRTNASEDTKNDENKFIVEVFVNGSLLETKQGATNLDAWDGADQYYNWSITPRENAIRWGGFIQAPLFKHPSQTIDKTKYQKESDAEYTNQNGDVVTELSNIDQSELADLILFPEIHIFDGLFIKEIIDQLNSDPHGYVTVNYEGVQYKDFIISVQGNPVTGKAKYTTIRANL